VIGDFPKLSKSAHEKEPSRQSVRIALLISNTNLDDAIGRFSTYAILERLSASRQQQRRCSMEMAYRERWQAEIAELQKILSGFDLRKECRWGKPCYTMDGKNVVIIQGFKEYCALGFFQGALLKDPKKLLVQLGQVQAARVMKFTSANEITTKVATIKAYVREAVAAEKAGMKVETKPPEFPVPEELKEKFRNDPRFKRAFEALTPGRQRGYLFHFAGAKQSRTRTARIEKAMPAIFEGRGFVERR
jgi:uncharacterized protein YdeI (YjbR/CyaY-like superfamily)